MFRFTKKPSSGSHSQCLAKITRIGSVLNTDVVQTLSVLWRHSMTCVACVLCTVQANTLTSARRLSLLVILAKHWLRLPDDGFFVNRNMLEQPL